MQHSFGPHLPYILGGVAILLVGWIVALVAGALTRKGLDALNANQRLATHTRSQVDIERIAGRIVFWAVLLMAVVGALSVMNVDGVTGPLAGFVGTIIPAAVLALVAWVVATLARVVVNKALAATQLDEKLSEKADTQPMSHTLGNVAFWLVLLLFLPAIVGVLQIQGLMAPLSAMMTKLLAMLPNLLAAAIIGVVGWVIAKVVRGIVSNLLAATGVDRFSESNENTRGIRLSQLGGTLAFVLVIVPTLIAALDALRIEAISRPLTRMLDEFLLAVPNVLAAAAILILAWFIGRFVAGLVTRLLANLGFDLVPQRIGLGHAFAGSPAGTDTVTPASDTVASGESRIVAPAGVDTTPPVPAKTASLSELAGKVALFFIMLFATVEAAALLGFGGVHALLEQFIAFGADILLGLVIFVVGYWLADLAGKAIERANPDGRGLARIARLAILGLVVAMGLRAMGVADDIVNLAFGLVLGAVAVSVALAFGLGGREAAGRIADRWASQYLDRRPPSGS
ncbi:mechanosensitive ion channel [Novilysobacter arseniciresistens]|uniref:mechanosensitive ion channel n=1 Tax=Novilysobacter arseniciresistens TaxID=1385522 RepID=UPI00068B094B|nr:mechanosensitive ion channel [Lysobacter arseniciresistens]